MLYKKMWDRPITAVLCLDSYQQAVIDQTASAL